VTRHRLLPPYKRLSHGPQTDRATLCVSRKHRQVVDVEKRRRKHSKNVKNVLKMWKQILSDVYKRDKNVYQISRSQWALCGCLTKA